MKTTFLLWDMKRMGGMEVELHGFLFRLYAEASSGHHSTAAVIPGKIPPCPVGGRLGGPQVRYALASLGLGWRNDCPRARALKGPAHWHRQCEEFIYYIILNGSEMKIRGLELQWWQLFIYNWYKIDTCFEVLLSFNVVTSIVYNPLPAMWKS